MDPLHQSALDKKLEGKNMTLSQTKLNCHEDFLLLRYFDFEKEDEFIMKHKLASLKKGDSV